MNEIEQKLQEIESRAGSATNWREATAVLRTDIPKLVHALRRAVRGLTILDGNGTIADIAEILSGAEGVQR